MKPLFIPTQLTQSQSLRQAKTSIQNNNEASFHSNRGLTQAQKSLHAPTRIKNTILKPRFFQAPGFPTQGFHRNKKPCMQCPRSKSILNPMFFPAPGFPSNNMSYMPRPVCKNNTKASFLSSSKLFQQQNVLHALTKMQKQ